MSAAHNMAIVLDGPPVMSAVNSCAGGKMLRTKSLTLDDLEITRSPIVSENFVVCDSDPTDSCVVICDSDPSDPCV